MTENSVYFGRSQMGNVGSFLFFDLGDDYMAVVTLWKCIELFTYDLSTFLYLIYFTKNLLTGKHGLHMGASEPKEFVYFTHIIPSF